VDSGGPKESYFTLGPRSVRGRGNFGGHVPPHCKVYGYSPESCRKTANPISMAFGMKTRVGPRDHVLGGGLDLPGGRDNLRVIPLIGNAL